MDLKYHHTIKVKTMESTDFSMTKKVNDLFLCEECNLLYRNKELAEKCEAWCREKKSCNLEITSHAVNKSDLSL